MHLSFKDGWTALMRASKAGQLECVKVLLDKGAEVNMQSGVSGVIIHCVNAMQHVPEVSSSECRYVHRTLLCTYMYMPCCLITESKYISRCNKSMMITRFTNNTWKD